jgi:hypothetical protein
MARDGGLSKLGVGSRSPTAWSAHEIELQALVALTPSAAHFLKSHQLLVQKFAADRNRQRSSLSMAERFPKISSALSAKVCGGSRSAKKSHVSLFVCQTRGGGLSKWGRGHAARRGSFTSHANFKPIATCLRTPLVCQRTRCSVKIGNDGVRPPFSASQTAPAVALRSRAVVVTGAAHADGMAESQRQLSGLLGLLPSL